MTIISQSAGYLNFYNTVALLAKEYAPADYVGFYANTTDIGPVTSNGTQWAVIGGGASSVSVLSFGADPTGVADSTAAINAASVAAVAAGQNAVVPGGTYKLASAVTGPFVETGIVIVTGIGSIVSNGISGDVFRSINYAGASSWSNSYIFMNGLSMTGTASAAPNGNVSPFNIYIGGDTVDTTTSGPGLLSLVSVEDAPQAGHTGGRNSILGQVIVVGSPAIAAGASGYVGGTFRGIVQANLGGTSGVITNYKGGIYGANPDAQAKSGATNVYIANGSEFDITVAAGANVANKHGLSIIKTAIDANRADYDDTALSFGDQDGSSCTWKYGLGFGGYAQKWSFGADSTLIYAWTRQSGPASASIALNGVDFRNVAFQVGGAAFISTGFKVDPAGIVTAAGGSTFSAASSALDTITATAAAGQAAGTFLGNAVANSNVLIASGQFTGAGNYVAQLNDLNNTNGVGIKMTGNGGTTASKTIRVVGGSMQILNDAGSATIMQFNDNLGVRAFGTFTVPGVGTPLLTTAAAATGGGTGNAPTLTAGPVAGNPTKWLAINDAGTTRFVPSW